MAILKQFLLLLWKNFVLQFRHPLITLVELGLPLVFTILLVITRVLVSSDYISNPTIYDSFSIDNLPGNIKKQNDSQNLRVLYAPNLTHIDYVMNSVKEKLHLDIKGFLTEVDIEKYNNENPDPKLLAGVIFTNVHSGSTTFSENISYKIRPKAQNNNKPKMKASGVQFGWRTNLEFPVAQSLGPREKNDSWGGLPGYMAKGFLTLQYAVDRSIVEFLINENISQNISLQMQRFPYPPYHDDLFILAIRFFFPIILLFSFIFPAINITKNLVMEKEIRIKETMKMMGLSPWLHWLCWFIKYCIFLTISAAIITVMLHVEFTSYGSVFRKTDPTLTFFILFIYICSTICFSFFMSSLFSKANAAAAGSGIIFFLTFIPFFALYYQYQDLTLPTKLATSLLSNTDLSLISLLISMFEGIGIGAQWNLLHVSPSPDDTLTIGYLLLMLVIDAIIYLILTWYIDSVFPGEYGIPLPCHFPFLKTYWCGPSRKAEPDHFPHHEKSSEFFEQEPKVLPPGIQAYGLTKIFDKKKDPAVNNFSLNMYRGQITVLLGHNGAGKTTAISMLTGLIPPSRGFAVVNGHDVFEETALVHSVLGICPQYDVLFDDLTVEEHLYFFCRLKNFIPDLVKEDVERMIVNIGLEPKKKVLAKKLSGGMKRKLSLGIALVGGSKIVILDEPTSGMDPSARRFVWDLLQAEKENRTILLTTHYMEEADVLGDRIAIMKHGEVQCCGSPLFLKTKYGAGYHLVITKYPNAPEDSRDLTELVTSCVSGAEVGNDSGHLLYYSLPHDSSHKFEQLFNEIETRKEEFYISSYGASITTMEEVFLKVASSLSLPENNGMDNPAQPIRGALSNSETGSIDSYSQYSVTLPSNERNTGMTLFLQQFWALLMKRILFTLRNRILTCSQILLSPAFLILILFIIKSVEKLQDSPPLELTLEPFHGTNVPYFAKGILTDISRDYVSYFHGKKDVLHGINSTDAIHHLINDSIADLGKYNMHTIISAVFWNDFTNGIVNLTALFNNQAFHSPAISLSVVDNALLRYFTKQNYSVTTINHPLPESVSDKVQNNAVQSNEAYQISQNIVFGMSFLLASFAVFLVKERSMNSKHLQRVSGINLITFWLSTFIWDFINYIIPCLVVLVVFISFKIEAYSSGQGQGDVFLLFVLHGLAALPFIYCFSFMFTDSTSAYVRICLFNVFAGIALLVTVSILETPTLDLQDTANTLDWVFTTIFPSFCLGRSINNLYQNKEIKDMCESVPIRWACAFKYNLELVKPCCKDICTENCLNWEDNPLSWTPPGIGRQLVFLVFQCFFYFLILTGLELNIFRSIKYFICSKRTLDHMQTEESHEDDDVQNERKRIMETSRFDLFSTDILILQNLRKQYDSFLAVNDLSLGIKKGECFGLLGINGAGKTSTIKMLTGDESITSGNAFLSGYNIKTDILNVQKNMGYCPQYDALIDQLTGRETLTMFARLHGIKEADIPYQVEKLSHMLDFYVHIDKQVGKYSGGNKRKLSSAIALIGGPSVLFLDEPSTGMDPFARRRLWNALLKVVQAGCSIVLTSHSMEECEVLCDRLVIMVNGEFLCLGSTHHLKSKYGTGFILHVKVSTKRKSVDTAMQCDHEEVDTESLNAFVQPQIVDTEFYVSSKVENLILRRNIDEVKSYIERRIQGSVFKGLLDGYRHLYYHIPGTEMSWSQMFGIMESAKTYLNIIDSYSVSQTTLEQIFLNFVRTQKSVDD